MAIPTFCQKIDTKGILYSICDLFENPHFLDILVLFIIVMIALTMCQWIYDIYHTIKVSRG
jgi:hypothetical protein